MPADRRDRKRPSTHASPLAAIPVGVAVLGALLLFPRSAVPESVPLPQVDARVLRRVADDDRERAARVAREPLPSDVREVGSAIRDLNRREAHEEDTPSLTGARSRIDALVPRILADRGAGALVDLRAAQLEAFLAEVQRYEAAGPAGVVGEELEALAGTFVRRMTQVGWCDERHKCALDDDERRVAFKVAWNGVAGVQGRPELAPTIDETRALYTFYLLHPHVPEKQKAVIEAARAAAKDPAACAQVAARERAAEEGWRLEKIDRLGAIDRAYPLDFARGVVAYRMGRYEAAAQAFDAWLVAHPDGPLAMRARNHLKAALEASR